MALLHANLGPKVNPRDFVSSVSPVGTRGSLSMHHVAAMSMSHLSVAYPFELIDEVAKDMEIDQGPWAIED